VGSFLWALNNRHLAKEMAITLLEEVTNFGKLSPNVVCSIYHVVYKYSLINYIILFLISKFFPRVAISCIAWNFQVATSRKGCNSPVTGFF